RREADDLRLPRRQRERPAAAAADEERRMGPLDRLRPTVVVGDRVVLAAERERAIAEAALQDRDRLRQARLTHRRRIEAQADGVVLGPVPSGADGDVEPPTAEDVD